MMSPAIFGPMPWMYCSAISTRLLVGMFTPAIRATYVSPVADPFGMSGLKFLLSRAGPQTRTRRPTPCPFGARHRLENYPTWMRGLLMDRIRFRQPILVPCIPNSPEFSTRPSCEFRMRKGTRQPLNPVRFWFRSLLEESRGETEANSGRLGFG